MSTGYRWEGRLKAYVQTLYNELTLHFNSTYQTPLIAQN